MSPLYTSIMASNTVFSINVNGVNVPIKQHAHSALPDSVLVPCVESKLLKDWASKVDPELKIKEILLTDYNFFGTRLGFLKMEVVAEFNGVRVPGICFLRGGAVSILVLLECEGKTYVILTKQPRVPVGKSGLLELPAGMLDGSGAFAGIAAKELAEETGILLRGEDLVDLTALTNSLEGAQTYDGMLPSAGGCDEFLRLLYHKRSVTRTELDAMRGKATGLIEEGEVIVLDIVLYEDAWKVCRDSKLLSSMLLYERLRASGSIM